MAISLIVVAFALCGGWVTMKEETRAKIKDTAVPVALAGLAGVGGLFKLQLVRIREGRLALGDLKKSVEHVVLLAAGEADRLEPFKPFLEGKVPLEELPQVQLAIQQQVTAKAAEVISQPIQGVVTEIPRILDSAWEAPV